MTHINVDLGFPPEKITKTERTMLIHHKLPINVK